MFDILSFHLPIVDIHTFDMSRLITVWGKCTNNISYDNHYGRENIYEDIMRKYHKNPFFVMYVMYDVMTTHEKLKLEITSWEQYVEKSIVHIVQLKCSEIKECLELFDSIRFRVPASTAHVQAEKILQNTVFRRYTLSRLWLTFYNLYSSLNYQNKQLQHLIVPFNVAEIHKYETIWENLKRNKNVDEIPEEFWKWLTEDDLIDYLQTFNPKDNLDTTKDKLIDVLFKYQNVYSYCKNEATLGNSVLDSKIRKLNERIKPEITQKIKMECAIFDNYEQLMKVYTVDECKLLLKHFCPKFKIKEEFTPTQLYYKLYLCIYIKNVKEYIKNKRKCIQKKILENILITTNILDYGFENNISVLISEDQMSESLKDFILPGDITNKWFVNMFKTFTEVDDKFQFFWKFRCSNFHVKDFYNFVYKNLSSDEEQHGPFVTLDNIAFNEFTCNDVTYAVIKIKSDHKSPYLTPPTYSALLKQLIGDGTQKRMGRSLYVISRIVLNSISNVSIMYKFSPNIINDNDVIEVFG